MISHKQTEDNSVPQTRFTDSETDRLILSEFTNMDWPKPINNIILKKTKKKYQQKNLCNIL